MHATSIATLLAAAIRAGLALAGCRSAPLAGAAESPPFVDPRGRPTSRLRGTYVSTGDAPSFVDCETGVMYPVASEGDRRILERAYASARAKPGSPVVVVVDSYVASRRVTSKDYVPALVIERFVAIEPDGMCAEKGSAPLENTYWKLVRIGERPVAAVDPKAEPHLRLDRNGQRVSGSGGCNRFTGGYSLDGDRITFTDLAPTRMFCAPAMDQERAYFGALAPAGRWRVDGKRLELFGPAGDRLHFEAAAQR